MKVFIKFYKCYIVLLAICVSRTYAWSFETLTNGVQKMGQALISHSVCRMAECCNERSIPANIRDLSHVLRTNVFGQHIVLQRLVPTLAAHFSDTNNARKPLVLSFQGPAGTGKNFVAEMIAKALYAKGLKSKFVHHYRARLDFPVAAKVNEYSAKIVAEVRTTLASCARSLFIFDEVDSMPAGIFEALSSLVGYSNIVDGQDYSQSVFILLSNNGASHISDHLGMLLKEKGMLRGETRLKDFEQLLKKSAYNLEGGMKKSTLIGTYLIDHYLPFLPLEKEHIVKCIYAELARRHGFIWRESKVSEILNTILADAIEYDPKFGIFVVTGCKKIGPEVSVYVQSNMHTSHSEF